MWTRMTLAVAGLLDIGVEFLLTRDCGAGALEERSPVDHEASRSPAGIAIDREYLHPHGGRHGL